MESIYRSTHGQAVIHSLYDKHLADSGIQVENKMISTRFGQTHVLLTGPEGASPLVLLHGGNTTNPATLGWFKPLLEKYRIYAPDTIGHPGKSVPVRLSPRDHSYGQWIVDVLDAFGLEQSAFLAGSYGAGILLNAAAYAPKRISKAVLIIPSGLVSIPGKTMFFDLLLPLIAYRLFPSRERLLKVLQPMFLGHPIPEELIEITTAVFRYVQVEAEMPRNVTMDEMSAFTAPILVLAGEKDRLFPGHKVAARAREIFPNLAAAEILPDSPHFIPQELLPTLNARVDRFLSGIE
ncbi:MAG: alpha/beta hydrolase [Anaerolineales bacterium]|nr:alpha/beta hydrolase [Anaerolineales bacterium]